MTIQKVLRRIFSTMALAGMISGLAVPSQAQARTAALQGPAVLRPQASYAVQHDLSHPLRNIKLAPLAKAQGTFQTRPRLPLPKAESASPSLGVQSDSAVQNQPAIGNMPAPQFNFEGTGNLYSVVPPDPNGDIGGDYYVQWVNLSMAVWHLDRTTNSATLVYGPASGSAIWAGFGGLCETTNQGDPIVLYDHLAGRWLMSQFAFTTTNPGPYYECIAISQTGDPTGAWYRYAFKTSDTIMNDYPHLGVWPDGYYMSTNQFDATNSWAGAGAWVFERDKMLAGLPARQVYFNLYNVNQNFGGMLPSDLDGPPPPTGTPEYFAEVDDSTWIGPQDALRIWEFHVDWTNPASSTFGVSGNPNAIILVSNFNPLCVSAVSYIKQCIPQPGTTARVDAVADRLMHRLQYRNFGSYATLVTNHTVDVGNSQAGVRWYELRRSGGAWGIQQQGTYSGDTPDSENRWMGSAAMDKDGDIAIGYSVSSSTVYPSIRYAGRLAGDPPDTLPQGEATLIAGGGSQVSSLARWGDYSMLGVDPTDDCTFWYTQEYYPSTSSSGWHTRIGSFAFPTCLATLKGDLQGTVTDHISGLPVAGAHVVAGSFDTLTDSSGIYQFQGLITGTYTVTVSAYGYQSASSSNVIIAPNQITTQDFALNAIPLVTVRGKVRDGSGQGWPLYARIDVSSDGFAKTLFTNPVSGTYSIQLAQGVPHTFGVSAVSPGYMPQSLVITPTLPGTTQDFSLLADAAACLAPGYANTSGCTAQSGGMVIGNIYDANTGSAVNGAVVSGSTITATSFATPDDPNLGDGFFMLFASPTGAQTISASAIHYGTDSQSLQILSGQTISSNFHLPAGRLVPNPAGITVNATSLATITRTISLSNTGALPATFSLVEVNAPAQAVSPTGPFAAPLRHISPGRLQDLDASGVYEYSPPQAPPLPGGTILQSWDTGLAHPWGIGYDSRKDRLWVGDVAAGGGENLTHAFSVDGRSEDSAISNSTPGAVFAAGMAYNPISGRFWQIAVGGDNCLVEIDPLQRKQTGEKICPAFDLPQRGLAYDPLTGTFYSGSWNNGILYHFNPNGTILDSANTDLNISGLAFNPITRHLFVLTNADQGFDVYLLDARDHYRILGGFNIPELEAFQGAGLSMDCQGNLWTVNQVTGMVYETNSGELAPCAWNDIPWLNVTPVTGTLEADGAASIQLSFDPGAAISTTNQAQMIVQNDAPYGPVSIPVTLTVKTEIKIFFPFLSHNR
jgi:hypothetical protein